MGNKNDLILATIEEVRNDQLIAQRTLKKKLWEDYQRELERMKYHLSRLANQAVAEGHSVSAIGRAYGTSNWNTIKQLIALTSGEVAAETAAVQSVEQTEAERRAYADAHPWEYDAETSTVTFHRWLGDDREYHYETRVLGWDPEADHGFGGFTGDTSGMTPYTLNRESYAVSKLITNEAPKVESTPTPTIDWTMFGMPDDEDEDE